MIGAYKSGKHLLVDAEMVPDDIGDSLGIGRRTGAESANVIRHVSDLVAEAMDDQRSETGRAGFGWMDGWLTDQLVRLVSLLSSWTANLILSANRLRRGSPPLNVQGNTARRNRDTATYPEDVRVSAPKTTPPLNSAAIIVV